MRGIKPTYHQCRQISKARKDIDPHNVVILKTTNCKDKDIYTIRNKESNAVETVECMR